MSDFEKVLKGLECCTTSLGCKACPYSEKGVGTDDCQLESTQDALELLKEQEALEPVEMIDDFYPIGDPLRTIGWKCGKCMERIAGYDNYCPNCGQAVKWDD